MQNLNLQIISSRPNQPQYNKRVMVMHKRETQTLSDSDYSPKSTSINSPRAISR